MLFENSLGKVAKSGELCKKFFERYEKIKHWNNSNIGWEIINSEMFPNDKIKKFETENIPLVFDKLLFLNSLLYKSNWKHGFSSVVK